MAAAEIVEALQEAKAGGVVWVRGPMYSGKSVLLCDVWDALEGQDRALVAYDTGDRALDRPRRRPQRRRPGPVGVAP